jgi:hypothetical protein
MSDAAWLVERPKGLVVVRIPQRFWVDPNAVPADQLADVIDAWAFNEVYSDVLTDGSSG